MCEANCSEATCAQFSLRSRMLLDASRFLATGDLGTSPLYVYAGIFAEGLERTPENFVGRTTSSRCLRARIPTASKTTQTDLTSGRNHPHRVRQFTKH